MKKVIPKGHQVETYRKFHDAEYTPVDRDGNADTGARKKCYFG